MLGVLGPMTSDNCLAVLPEIERLGLPTGTICGSTKFTVQYAYAFPNGGLAGEPAAYDLGHAFALALGRMRIAIPGALRDALDTLRRVPSCTGGPGTIITLGPQARRSFGPPRNERLPV